MLLLLASLVVFVIISKRNQIPLILLISFPVILLNAIIYYFYPCKLTHTTMLKNFREQINAFIDKYKLRSLSDVALFGLITIVIHFAWRSWAADALYWPIKPFMDWAYEFMAHQVFVQSHWFDVHILGMDITTIDNTMYFSNKGYISITAGCSGLKQFSQFAILMMLFRGPWKKKLWFIPLGVFIVHLTNLFRITGLSVVLLWQPDYWQFSHDYLFRPFFYVVIFFMWIWWVEKIAPLKEN